MVERPPPPDLPIRQPVPLPSPWRTIRRNTVYAVIGVLVLFHEIVISPEPRGLVLVFAAALMGLPPILGANEVGKALVRRIDEEQK